MSLRDDLLPMIEQIRAIPEELGLRTTAVAIVVTQWSAPVGTLGATVISATTTPITPTPKVVRAGNGRASAFGSGFGSLAVGGLSSDEYTIGPITPDYSTGGYTPSVILPAGAADKTVQIKLSGEGFTGDEMFEVVPDSVDIRPLRMMLRVRRTKQ